MASGRVKRRIERPDTWQLRPAVHQVNKALANTEPSTHGAKRTLRRAPWLARPLSSELKRLSASVERDHSSLRSPQASWKYPVGDALGYPVCPAPDLPAFLRR